MANATYRRLLAAQLISLVGTGVTTVALGLLAYDLSATHAGAILGAALALKMVAYVGVSPLIAAFAHRVDRRRLLISLDLARAAIMLGVPVITSTWQVLALVFVVNACAAGFTPAFQATIPEVLPDDEDYLHALSFSRAAYDLADLASPVAAAGLLLLVDFHALFAIDAASFVLSALLIASTTLPAVDTASAVSDRTWSRITLGARVFTRTPALRGLLCLNLTAAAASAMVIVNTVVLVRGELQLTASHVALALTASGAGSIATTLLVPALLRRTTDRTLMLSGAALLAAMLLVTATFATYAELLATWTAAGVGLALVQTPIGRLIQSSASPADRPPLFAAQFALSHACWLATYPVAGILGAHLGISLIAVVLAAIAATSTVVAALLWRTSLSAA